MSKGIRIEETAEEVIIRFRKDGDFGPSKSGKSTIVATTAGNVRVGDVMVGVNAYR